MKKPAQTVAQKRRYAVASVTDAKKISKAWLERLELSKAITFGLPEVDDRYHVWRVPLRRAGTTVKVGEVVLDAFTTEILEDKSTARDVLESRLLKRDGDADTEKKKRKAVYARSTLRNTVAQGDCVTVLNDMPAKSVELIFTSPPYFNARPEYSEYDEYEGYLLKMRQVIRSAHRVLADGRFFVMNSAPVLLRRASRNEASRRIAVPFDLHRIFIEEGYDFIDDIIWVKPEGAGWATGRGRRFAADRNPLQYKAVPVTEYVMVYRKRTAVLIDWHIRNHPDQDLIKASKIADGYEKTNVWRIHPKTNSEHPAAFPLELAQKVISYYSFKGDVVMDPFAGSGTVGEAAVKLGRKFVLAELNPSYIELIKRQVPKWLGRLAAEVLWMNTPAPALPFELF